MIYNFSSLSSIFYEGIGYGLNGEIRTWLGSVPQKLLTAAFRSSEVKRGNAQRASRIAHDLAHTQGTSLQSLMWHSFDSRSLTSDICSVVDLDDENELKVFQRLKQLLFNAHNFATAVMSGDYANEYESRENFYVDYVAAVLPNSLE